MLGTLSLPLLGSLHNDDGDGNEDGKKAKGLDWQNNNFTSASRFFYISLPWLHDYNVNVPIFTFCREREHKTTTFFFFSWTFILSLLEFNYKKFANIWRIKRDGVSATKFEATRIQLNFRKRRRRCFLSCLLTILRLRSAKSRNLSPPPLQKNINIYKYISSKVQLVVYYEYCVLIGRSATRLYVIAH